LTQTICSASNRAIGHKRTSTPDPDVDNENDPDAAQNVLSETMYGQQVRWLGRMGRLSTSCFDKISRH